MRDLIPASPDHSTQAGAAAAIAQGAAAAATAGAAAVTEGAAAAAVAAAAAAAAAGTTAYDFLAQPLPEIDFWGEQPSTTAAEGEREIAIAGPTWRRGATSNTPPAVFEWAPSVADFEDLLDPLKRINVPQPWAGVQPFYEDEEGVRDAFRGQATCAVNHVLSAQQLPRELAYFKPGQPTTVGGKPAFSAMVWRVEGRKAPANERPVVVVGEAKDPTLMEPIRDDISHSSNAAKRKFGEVVRQVYGYLKYSEAQPRAAFITTYFRSWFMLVDWATGDLFLTRPWAHAAAAPSIRQMLYVLTRLGAGRPPAGRVRQWSQELYDQVFPPGEVGQTGSAAGQQQQQQQGQPLQQAARFAELPDSQLLTIGSLIGRGACGIVRSGSFRGHEVAVKLVDACKEPDAVARLGNEASAYAALHTLQGRCIPVLHGAGLIHGGAIACLVTALVKGVPLGAAHAGRPSDAQASAALQALQSIHEQGFLHGDIRAANIVLVGPDQVVLLDLDQCQRFGQEEQWKASREEEQLLDEFDEAWSNSQGADGVSGTAAAP